MKEEKGKRNISLLTSLFPLLSPFPPPPPLFFFRELVAVLPGGAEEAVRGHENSYTIRWKSTSGRKRVGFAKVALSCGKPVKVCI